MVCGGSLTLHIDLHKRDLTALGRLNDEVAKLRDLEEMERASRHSNAIPPQVGNGPAHANSRHPESSAKKWWAGDVVVALTDTVITDLRDTYHIILDPAYHKQVTSLKKRTRAELFELHF